MTQRGLDCIFSCSCSQAISIGSSSIEKTNGDSVILYIDDKQESDEADNQPLDKRKRAEHWTQPWWWSRQKLCPTKTGTSRTSTANANSPILGPSQVSWLARILKISVQKTFAGLSAPHQILSIQWINQDPVWYLTRKSDARLFKYFPGERGFQ